MLSIWSLICTFASAATILYWEFCSVCSSHAYTQNSDLTACYILFFKKKRKYVMIFEMIVTNRIQTHTCTVFLQKNTETEVQAY